MITEKYLLDSNVFITPYRTYYPFDFAKSFWKQLEEKLKLDEVTVLDVVVAELTKTEDDLSKWIKGIEGFKAATVKEDTIISNYAAVLDYVQRCGLYREEALRDWARGDIADPWLIAAAIGTETTIITTERATGGFTKGSLSRRAKIPDVARHFEIQCEDLFYFMRRTGFRL